MKKILIAATFAMTFASSSGSEAQPYENVR
ncbi:hypothetical protein M2386_004647 [Erwinia rhapontici]|nr:hypothetical protein [Erwinia rhapontici]